MLTRQLALLDLVGALVLVVLVPLNAARKGYTWYK
jgi:hypothetical protein